MMPKAVVDFGIQSMAQSVLTRFSAAIDLIAEEKRRQLKKEAKKAIAKDLLNMIDSPEKFNRYTLIIDSSGVTVTN
jgi:molecular chaperone GrpE (heat shock protein)